MPKQSVLPENWKTMYRFEQESWIMENWFDHERNVEIGDHYLKPDTPEEIRKIWEQFEKEDREAMANGIMLD